jgi:PIN domain nuclease of toxin-antitoxin system
MERGRVSEVDALLLDTHTLIWWATNDRALSRRVRQLIQAEDTRVYVSAASAWEIATKVRHGKLRWDPAVSVETYCSEQRFEKLPVTFAHASRAGSWPQDHGNPFDRMLAAQSAIESIPLATNDAKMAVFGVRRVW